MEDCKERMMDTTSYYAEAFGTPEEALEIKERLHQLEEYKISLEAEV